MTRRSARRALAEEFTAVFGPDVTGEERRVLVLPLLRSAQDRVGVGVFGAVGVAGTVAAVVRVATRGAGDHRAIWFLPLCAVAAVFSAWAQVFRRRVVCYRLPEDDPGEFHIERDSGARFVRAWMVCLVAGLVTGVVIDALLRG